MCRTGWSGRRFDPAPPSPPSKEMDVPEATENCPFHKQQQLCPFPRGSARSLQTSESRIPVLLLRVLPDCEAILAGAWEELSSS